MRTNAASTTPSSTEGGLTGGERAALAVWAWAHIAIAAIVAAIVAL